MQSLEKRIKNCWSIAVIMTVYNRSDKTKRCMESILKGTGSPIYQIDFFITNDASTDNTVSIIEEYAKKIEDSKFHIINGTGSLFWNRGMHAALEEALKFDYDYYLFVNNDVEFDNDFMAIILNDALKASNESRYFAICGSCHYINTKERSYGGARLLSRLNPYKREILIPNGNIQKCDLMNANCVLIPYDTAQAIGNLDSRYEHAVGDYDYGLRIKRKGGQCYIASDFVGACDRNSDKGTWKDPSLSFKERIRKKNQPNGLPWRSELIYLKTWFPFSWPYYLVRPYLVLLVTSLKYRVMNKQNNAVS
jgi:Predicted glycosyltransferases